MTFTETMFGLQGRLNGAAYIGYGFLDMLLLFAIVGVLVSIGGAAAKGAKGSALMALACSAPLVLALCWSNIALCVKRLHDMDMSGAHLVWIFVGPAALTFALGVVGGVLGSVGGTLLGSLLSLGIGLWLWCAPGTDGSNRFGEPRA